MLDYAAADALCVTLAAAIFAMRMLIYADFRYMPLLLRHFAAIIFAAIMIIMLPPYDYAMPYCDTFTLCCAIFAAIFRFRFFIILLR